MIGLMNDAKKENRNTRHARINVARYSKSSGVVNDFSKICQKAKSINHDAKLSRVNIMIVDRRVSVVAK